MVANKFELFMCCLGNGLTLCNKAITENHDYKQIGHISRGGNIKLYVKDGYIPSSEMKKINRVASEMKEKFQEDFNRLSEVEQYGTILDSVPNSRFVEFIKDKRVLSEKLPEMKEYYFSIS